MILDVRGLRWPLHLAVLLGLLVLAPASVRLPAAPLQPVQDKATASADEIEKGRQLLQRHEYFEALKTFQRANQLAGGRSAECYVAMAQAMLGMKTYQNVVETAQTAIELAQDDSRLLARAHSVRGLAFQSLAEKDPAKLRDAETEFRVALAADPGSRIADLHFNLGVVLMKQQRDDEGIVELQQEVALRPHGTTADDARALIANPRRAREPYAPDFSLVAAGGESITSASLRGKVVLINFWATNCSSCVRAMPSLRKLQSDHAKDAFVILGISVDADEPAWRAFTAKNGMVWPQYLDGNRQIGAAFGVHDLPTYVLIDGEGIERLRVTGVGFQESKALSSAIDNQLKR
jgi:peroxiredoxin/Tfp pilus assembly protein PilF